LRQSEKMRVKGRVLNLDLEVGLRELTDESRKALAHGTVQYRRATS